MIQIRHGSLVILGIALPLRSAIRSMRIARSSLESLDREGLQRDWPSLWEWVRDLDSPENRSSTAHRMSSADDVSSKDN